MIIYILYIVFGKVTVKFFSLFLSSCLFFIIES